MRWRTTFKDLGLLIQIPAALSIPAACVCLVFGEWSLLPGFVIAAGVALGLGQYLARRPVDDEPPHLLIMSMVTVGAAWLLISLVAAIPFIYWGQTSGSDPVARPYGGFWTALFESMSGITSTGLTMAEDASLLPRSIQWWRTLLEWTGGVGVVVLALAILQPAEKGKTLMTAEAREHRIGHSFKATGRRIWWIYCSLSLLSILLFAATGMPLWEAVNHGMTGIATGGFTVTADSFTGYGTGIKLSAIFIMILGAVSFRSYATVVIDRDWKALIRDVPLLTLLGLLVTGMVVLLLSSGLVLDGEAIIAMAFQWGSALGTCGFQTADLLTWSGPSLMLLTLGMFIGGTSGSTTGGLKIDRAILVVLGPIWHMRRRLSTRKGVQYYTIDGQKVKELDALHRYRSAAALASLFVGCILLGTFVLMLTIGTGYAPHQVLFETISAMSNVGLSTGITGPSLPWLAKLTLIVLMWMGRLEVTAVLVFIGLPLVLSAERGSKGK